jgi:tetratricopeptide (TPR) repeat protein/mono/diheme cytochrome c family protein
MNSSFVYFVYFVCFVVSILGLGSSLSFAEEKTDLTGKARQVFRTNCYRCHGQEGAVEGGMNYVLDLTKLVSRKKVVPGEPAKSKIFKRLISKTNPMPPEEEKSRPSPADIEIIRQWIEVGAPDGATHGDRQLISEAAVIHAISTDLQKLEARARPFVRYFTITHLYNAGFSEDELETYRHGLSKLINSLSWETAIAKPQAIDPARTIFRIDLRDYRWSRRTWQRLLDEYPYGVLLSSAEFRAVQATTECELPYVRADWFVHAASRPPLYHALLRLPETEAELLALLKIDGDGDIQAQRVVRAGFNSSGVSRNNRLIERHATAFGAYWKSYDFAGNAGRKNLFAHPLGPGNDESSFRQDGGEIIFHLPNGLLAFLLVNGQGRRLDEGPVQIVSVKSKPDPRVINGISCMFCHSRGLIDKADQIRGHVLKNPQAFPDIDIKTVLALYPEEKRFSASLAEDTERFQRAVQGTGAKLGGTDPIVALSERFESELDLTLAAAEVGPGDLRPSLKLLGAFQLSPRLAQRLGALKTEGGTVQRQVFVECFEELVDTLGAGTSLPALNRKIAKYTDSIERNQRDPKLFCDRGQAYSAKGDFDRALVDLSESIRLDPSRAASFVQRAWIHLVRQEYEASIADNTEALRLDPVNPDAYFNRGGARAHLGQLKEAAADYSEVIRLEPKNAAAFANRARAQAGQGLLESALSDWSEAYALDSGFLPNLKDSARTLLEKRQANVVIQILEQLLRRFPQDREIRKLQSWIKEQKKR